MTKGTWTSAFETGVLVLDIDLRMLFGMIDQLRDASASPAGVDGKNTLLIFLAATIAHFDREQRLMVECKYDYERAAKHEAEHETLLSKLLRQIESTDAGIKDVTNIAQYLGDWLQAHVTNEDIPLGAAIISQKGIVDRRTNRMLEDHDKAGISSFRRIGPMAPIVWTSKIAVGIEDIDSDHKKLIDCFNEILVARVSLSKEAMAVLLEKLGDATAEHFRNEEQLMAAQGYKDALHHQDEHHRLLDEYGHQVDDWRCDRTSVDGLCRFMYGWLLKHIIAMDMPLGSAIRAQRNS